MKNYITLIVFQFSISFMCSAQNNIELIIHPKKLYSSEVKRTTKIKTKKIIDKESKKILDSLSIPIVQNIYKEESFIDHMITKQKDTSNFIPFEYTAFDFHHTGRHNGKKINLKHPYSTISVYGYFNSWQTLNVEKLYLDNKRSNEESIFRKLMAKNSMNIPFPKNKMKPGDSFLWKSSITYSIPYVGPEIYELDLLLTLKKIKNQIAFFDIKLNSFKKLNIKELFNYVVTARGNMQFDISNNYISKISIKRTLNLIEKIDDKSKTKHHFTEIIDVNTIIE